MIIAHETPFERNRNVKYAKKKKYLVLLEGTFPAIILQKIIGSYSETIMTQA